MTYFHGVETIETKSAGVTVQGVKSSVVGLVGTAPIHHVDAADRKTNVDVLCLSDVDDVKYFGPNVAGYTIPQALETLRAEGTKFVVVVNVFDPATHKTSVAAADYAIGSDLKAQLADGDIISAVVKVGGGAGSALVEGTDYTLDYVTGQLTIIAGAALDAETDANVAYDKGSTSSIASGDVIGGVDGGGNRTGAQAWLNSFGNRGFHPKILLAPQYSTQSSVVAAMRTLAASDKLRAILAVDAPVGTSVADAIAGRGPAGSINFNVAGDRSFLCCPHVYVYNKVTDSNVLVPLSTTYAGVVAKTDATLGFWHTPSNKQSLSMLGLEYPISASINDKASDAAVLNGAGIITVFNIFGSGYRIWGNRSAAFPGDGSVNSLVTQRRIADQIHESLENAMLNVIDVPITSTTIGDVLQGTNAYMRGLVSRKAVPPGSRVEFQTAKNPASEIAKGKTKFTIIFVGSVPMENIIFESVVDTTLLAAAAA